MMQQLAEVGHAAFAFGAFVLGVIVGGFGGFLVWVLVVVGLASRTARKRKEQTLWDEPTSRIENEEVQYVQVRGKDRRVDEFDPIIVPEKSRPH